MKTWYVYFIFDTVALLTKIGMTSNLRARFAKLQTSTGHRLRVREFIACDTKDEAKWLETFCHDRYLVLRRTGEWFANIEDWHIYDVKKHSMNFTKRPQEGLYDTRNARQRMFEFERSVVPQVIAMPEVLTFTTIVQAGRKAA
jgi:Meiotically up-regulated gene 113